MWCSYSAKSGLQLAKLSSDEPTAKSVNMIKGSKKAENQQQVSKVDRTYGVMHPFLSVPSLQFFYYLHIFTYAIFPILHYPKLNNSYFIFSSNFEFQFFNLLKMRPPLPSPPHPKDGQQLNQKSNEQEVSELSIPVVWVHNSQLCICHISLLHNS